VWLLVLVLMLVLVRPLVQRRAQPLLVGMLLLLRAHTQPTAWQGTAALQGTRLGGWLG